MADGDSMRFWESPHQMSPAFVTAYLETGRPAPHVHEEWQFAIPEIRSGLSLGAFRRYPTRDCDVAVVPPYEVHAEGGAIEAAPRWRALYVSPSVLLRLHGEVTGSGHAAPRFQGSVLQDPAAALELQAVLRAGEEGRIAVEDFETAVLHWLRHLLRRHAFTAIGTDHSPAVQRARAYLQERPTQPVTLPEVAAAAGLTTCHLVRSFSRAVGLPPKRYHAQVRIARAQRLLAEGEPVTRVAYECGFADQSHLSRSFKESCGVTPRAFQVQIRGTAKVA